MNYLQTISMVLFQECRFGKSHVHPFFSTCSAAKVDCSENSFTLSDLKEKLNGIELYKILQQTSGIIIEEDQLHVAKICESHYKFYGKKFDQDYAKKQRLCKYPEHFKLVSKKQGIPLYQAVSFESSWRLLKEHKMFVPYKTQICLKCATDISSKLTNPIDPRTLDLNRMRKTKLELTRVDQGQQQQVLLPEPSDEVEEPVYVDNDPDYSQEAEEEEEENSDKTESEDEGEDTMEAIKEDMRRLQRRIMKIQGLENKIPKSKVPFAGLSSRSKGRIKAIVAQTVKVGISVMTDLDEDILNVWKYCRDSGLIELCMGEEVMVCTMAEVLINAYNNAVNPQEKRRILSAFVPRFPKFAMIKKFNKPDIGPPTNQDEQEPLTQEEAKSVPQTEVRFKETITPYLWRQATIHYHTHHHAMAAIDAPIRYVWRVDPQIIELIMDYIFSSDITNNVAFGTYCMKGTDGTKYYVAKTIREAHNSEIVRQLQSLISEHVPASKVPSPRTLFKILALMPATGGKEMKGINNTLEEERKAITRLTEIVEELEDLFESNKDSTMDNTIQRLKEGIAVMGNYLKYYFPHNLSLDSTCIDHCCRFSTSDKNTKVKDKHMPFRSVCDHPHPENERCNYCKILPNLMQELEMTIDYAQKYCETLLSKTQILEMRHDSKMARKSIENYKDHLRRHHVQALDIEKLFKEKEDGTRVIVTIDFAMKLLPR